MEAYPLQWPPCWPRNNCQENSRFGDLTIAKGTKELLDELRKMGASEIIISTNLRLKMDGLPYSNQKQPDDCGVAVYFKLKRQPQCFPCDRWSSIQDNMRAIAKTIDALRGISRWGAEQMVNAAFTGFKALPPAKKNWWEVLGVQKDADRQQVESAFNKLAMKFHPDHGGNHTQMAELNAAMSDFRNDSRGLLMA